MISVQYSHLPRLKIHSQKSDVKFMFGKSYQRGPEIGSKKTQPRTELDGPSADSRGLDRAGPSPHAQGSRRGAFSASQCGQSTASVPGPVLRTVHTAHS